MCSELTIGTPELHQLTSVLFNPIRDDFFPVTSTNVGKKQKNF